MAPPVKGGGNILTRKFGPLPGWAWAGLGVAGYLVYKQRKAATAAAATGTTPVTSTAATAPIAQAPSGYGYQGPGAGWGGSGPIPTGATAATSAAYTPDPNATLTGSGYSDASTNAGTSSSGQQYENLSWTSAVPLIQSGQQVYYQPAPGVFQPAVSGSNLIPGLAQGTPLFVSVPSSGTAG